MWNHSFSNISHPSSKGEGCENSQPAVFPSFSARFSRKKDVKLPENVIFTSFWTRISQKKDVKPLLFACFTSLQFLRRMWNHSISPISHPCRYFEGCGSVCFVKFHIPQGRRPAYDSAAGLFWFTEKPVSGGLWVTSNHSFVFCKSSVIRNLIPHSIWYTIYSVNL